MSATAPAIRQRSSLQAVLHRALDVAAIIIGLSIANRLTGHWTASAPTPLFAAGAVIIFYLLAEGVNVYRNWEGISARREIACALGTWLVTLPLAVALGMLRRWFDQRETEVALVPLLIWLPATAALMGTGRLAMRALQRMLRAKGIHSHGYAIIGVNELGFQLARNVEAAPHLGLRLVGLFDDRPAHRIPAVPEDVGRHVGTIQELIEHARAGVVDRIYITLPMRAEERIKRLLTELSDSTASVHIVPDFFVFELLHSCWTDIGGLPVVSVFEHPFYGVDGLLKRATDLALAIALLVFLGPLMLIVALAIKLTSPGPVFFRQRRYGMDGKEIRVWKFRSMRVCDDGQQVAQATKNDARLTPIGGFLRKTSLDELPQLFNVLAGNMSLVGPRPHASAHNEEYRRRIRGYMLRHKVKPGITGLAQVSGWRGETDTLYKMEKRIELDHRYIREWSWWNDVAILFRTAFTVLRQENAY
jgi:putative colanic acid biosynthesis UDP-glucose lipid carrier transferase